MHRAGVLQVSELCCVSSCLTSPCRRERLPVSCQFGEEMGAARSGALAGGLSLRAMSNTALKDGAQPLIFCRSSLAIAAASEDRLSKALTLLDPCVHARAVKVCHWILVNPLESKPRHQASSSPRTWPSVTCLSPWPPFWLCSCQFSVERGRLLSRFWSWVTWRLPASGRGWPGGCQRGG